MSGIERIKTRLTEECKSQCEAMELKAIEDAKLTIAERIAKAESEAAQLKDAAEDRAENVIEKAKSSAALESRQAMLKAKVDMLEDIISKAEKKLHNLDTPSYFGVLKMIADKNIQKGEGIMFLCEKDLERLPADFEQSLERVVISKVPCDISDGFILKYGDIEINCTFHALVNAQKDELKAVASQLLFG